MNTNIYIIRNTVNNKVYVGQSKNVERRFKNHMKAHQCESTKKKKLAIDLELYGKDVFYYEILAENIKMETAGDIELEYIKKYDSVNNGYNVSYNTYETGKRSAETRRKISDSQRGEKNQMYGKTPVNAKRVLCIDTNEEFKSATECANHYNLSVYKICCVCRGTRKTHGKMRFKYID